MTWDPTDKQGWKRVLDTSSLLSMPPHVTKKGRFDVATDRVEVKAINENVDLDTNDNENQANPSKDGSATRELPNTERPPMQPLFSPKHQRPLFQLIHEPTQPDFSNIESPGHYCLFHSPYSQVGTNMEEASKPPEPSACVPSVHVDPNINSNRSTFNPVDDVTATLTTSHSSSFTWTDVFAHVAVTPAPGQLEGRTLTTASAKPHTPPSQALHQFSERQGFVFGNGGNGLDRGYDSDYFGKIKNNPYTSSLLRYAPVPRLPVPPKIAKLKALFPGGHYGQPERGKGRQHTFDELQVLSSLRKRLAKLKAMCDTAGIDTTGDAWERTTAVVEGDKPYIEQNNQTGKGVEGYLEQIERWDKAVGHQAILMKCLHYKRQIAVLEKRVKEIEPIATEDLRNGELQDAGTTAIRVDAQEWKGHKTRLGRRFSGLIEKN